MGKATNNLKASILAGLTDLRTVIDFNDPHNQVVQLQSEHYDKFEAKEYTLAIDLIVRMKIENSALSISGFTIENVHLFYNKGEKPDFNYTRSELIDYIDF